MRMKMSSVLPYVNCADNTASFDDGSEQSMNINWIQYFCSIAGHEYFTEVPESFIEDGFNLTGLNGQVPFYNEAWSLIMDVFGTANPPAILTQMKRQNDLQTYKL